MVVPAQDSTSTGIRISKAQGEFIEPTVISMTTQNAPLENCSGLTFFDNEAPSVTLLEGQDITTSPAAHVIEPAVTLDGAANPSAGGIFVEMPPPLRCPFFWRLPRTVPEI
jgi:hypothetical protein